MLATSLLSAVPTAVGSALSKYSSTNEDLSRNDSTFFSVASVTADSASGLTGRPAPVAAKVFWFSAFIRKFRKSAHSGGAFTEQENPSPPPKEASGLPWPPDTAGKPN